MRFLATILAFFSIAASAEADAQTVAAFRQRLSEPAFAADGSRQGIVSVAETSDAAEIIRRADGSRTPDARIRGYRLGIFSDNGASANESSIAVQEAFEKAFPDIRVYRFYDNPYFKVTAGDCITEEEAVMLLARVRNQFPKAYVVRAEMSLSDFVPEDSQASDDENAEDETTSREDKKR